MFENIKYGISFSVKDLKDKKLIKKEEEKDFVEVKNSNKTTEENIVGNGSWKTADIKAAGLSIPSDYFIGVYTDWYRFNSDTIKKDFPGQRINNLADLKKAIDSRTKNTVGEGSWSMEYIQKAGVDIQKYGKYFIGVYTNYFRFNPDTIKQDFPNKSIITLQDLKAAIDSLSENADDENKVESFNNVFEEMRKEVPDRTSTIEEKEKALSYIERMLACDDIPNSEYWENKKSIIEMEIIGIKNCEKIENNEDFEEVWIETRKFIEKYDKTPNPNLDLEDITEYELTYNRILMSFFDKLLAYDNISEEDKKGVETRKVQCQNQMEDLAEQLKQANISNQIKNICQEMNLFQICYTEEDKNNAIACIDKILNIEGISDDLKTYFEAKKAAVQNNNTRYLEFVDKDIVKNLKDIKIGIKQQYMWKSKDVEDFNNTFKQKLAELVENGDNLHNLYTEFKDMKLSHPITIEAVQEWQRMGMWSINIPAGIVFDDMDWSDSAEVFKYLSFHPETFSKTSPEHFPEGFDPMEVFEKGKTIGLGIDEAHNMGYTGSGINYAVIDSGFPQHEGLNFTEYNVAPSSDPELLEHYHGGACSYIAQQIAPGGNCYYYAQPNGGDMGTYVIENLRAILEKNKTLPEGEKIRFVSMSMGLFGGEEAQQLVKELEAQGVWVFYSGCPEDKTFGYTEKIDLNGDPDDFNNYQALMPGNLYVNSGSRTVPDPSAPDAWRCDGMASQSWSIPVIAGYYTLACQADPTMTKERFMALAEATAQTVESTQAIFDDFGAYIGRTEETIQIKIIDIVALLKAIEAEKEQNS